MKTAELFALSCELGGWLSGATAEERAALRGYGLALGTAYQIFDDCVDLFAVESVAGKSLGTDIAKGKLTLPVLVALERATPADRAALQAFIESWEPANLGELLAILERCDALAESRRVMDGYLARAQRALATLPESDPRTALAEVARFLARQTEGLGLS
jgi:octaprenyl-diphosphate synthase